MSIKIDWENLGFNYFQTSSHVKMNYSDNNWSDIKLVSEPYLKIHIAATILHYGQGAFEGLKAFCCKDGKIRVFRPDENYKRMKTAAERVYMPMFSEKQYFDALTKVIADNSEYVPPYGTGGSLYIRPLLIGTGPTIGVSPSNEYVFLIIVMPVGNYYKGGIKPVSALVVDGYDRAAPSGVGNVKIPGNYAASFKAQTLAKKAGYPINLYLDSKTHSFIDEFGTSNFIAITKDGKYVTPSSKSILPSITNKSLRQLATDLDINVEVRPIKFDEISKFAEIAACGTAVVLTPINEIVSKEKIYTISQKDKCGPILQKLYDHITALQRGEIEDPHNWMWDSGVAL
ncbi:MAG: branched-chain amino acid aminotransferase [Verrucomicrobiota bacterium]|nr:branched-chain amino acid aminotransferase [Verrucomicrobiota bacterium]